MSLEETFISKFYLEKHTPNQSIIEGRQAIEIEKVATQLNLPSTLMIAFIFFFRLVAPLIFQII
jgi:hypothetical protein